MSGNIRLVVFDVEGIIIPNERYFLEAMQFMDIPQRVKILVQGLLYMLGLKPLKSSLTNIYQQFKGLRLSELEEAFDHIPLIPGVEQVMTELKEKGITTALISSGIVCPLLERLAFCLGIDYFEGPTLDVEEGRITGKIRGEVIEDKGKGKVLQRLLHRLDIKVEECVVIADDRNNLSMFNLGVRKIGFNPDFILRRKSDQVVRGDLLDVLPLLDIDRLKQRRKSQYDSREAIHIGSFLVPLLSHFLGFDRTILCLLILTAATLFVLSEFRRIQGRGLPLITKITHRAAIHEERWNYATAPFLFALGIIFSLLLFPSPASYVAVTVVTLGDGFAKLIGTKLGKIIYPFNRSKTLEGTLAGFAISAAASMLYVDPLVASFAATAGMVMEALPSPINDNLSVPLIAGLVASIAS